MGKTVSVDEETYGELVTLTGTLMLKSKEAFSIGSIVRLAVAYLNSSLRQFPDLEKAILELILDEDTRFTSVEKITSEWFDKDFLETTLGIKKVDSPELQERSAETIRELRDMGIDHIFAFHEGNQYKAEITENYEVLTLHDNKKYQSLSKAASAIRGYNENGWRFWKYKDNEDKYIPLEELRTEQSKP